MASSGILGGQQRVGRDQVPVQLVLITHVASPCAADTCLRTHPQDCFQRPTQTAQGTVTGFHLCTCLPVYVVGTSESSVLLHPGHGGQLQKGPNPGHRSPAMWVRSKSLAAPKGDTPGAGSVELFTPCRDSLCAKEASVGLALLLGEISQSRHDENP